MKIIHIAAHKTGGAGIASNRIHKKILSIGFNSEIYFLEDFINKKSLFNLILRFKSFIEKYLFSGKKFLSDEFLFLNVNELNVKGLNSKFIRQIDTADIVFVHWISNHLNSYDLSNLYYKTSARIIYIMMDLAHITGGCHYPRDCNYYTNGCFNCPALSYSNKILAFKQQLVKSLNVAKFRGEILAFSDIDLKAAINSSIPFYKYWRLDIPFEKYVSTITKQDKFIILPSAYSFFNNRKGINYFKQILYILESILDSSDIIYIYNIDYPESYKSHFSKIKFLNFKYSTDSNDLTALYESSSVVCFTSISDSAPQFIIESLLLNTKVFSFDVGYVNEVLDSINGEVIIDNDVHKMAIKLYEYYLERKQNNFSKNLSLSDTVVKFTESDNFKRQFEELVNG